LITVITVVFNGDAYLEKTILSVINQTYDNVEYIIIDGGSTDGTLDIIRKYEEKIDYWVSEKDKGIYDAMNKGLKLPAGSYTVFMNAGDIFPSEKTLYKVANQITQNNYPGFVYGDVIEITMNGKAYLRKSRSLDAVKIGMFTCHQSMYYKNQILKENNILYNLDYKIFADYNFTCRFLDSSKDSLYINEPLSKFELGGLSTLRWYEGLLENNRTRKTILKMSLIQRMIIHHAQVLWHIIKFKVPVIHRIIRYKKHED